MPSTILPSDPSMADVMASLSSRAEQLLAAEDDHATPLGVLLEWIESHSEETFGEYQRSERHLVAQIELFSDLLQGRDVLPLSDQIDGLLCSRPEGWFETRPVGLLGSRERRGWVIFGSCVAVRWYSRNGGRPPKDLVSDLRRLLETRGEEVVKLL